MDYSLIQPGQNSLKLISPSIAGKGTESLKESKGVRPWGRGIVSRRYIKTRTPSHIRSGEKTNKGL